VVSDASQLGLDNVVDATFAGKTADLEREFNKARGDGAAPAAIISAALRQLAQLHRMRLAIDGGETAETAMARSGPPVHFSRKDKVEAALRVWSSARLLRAMQQLADATLDTRRQPALAGASACYS
jgi:DNA polymerase-3 subunit delta